MIPPPPRHRPSVALALVCAGASIIGCGAPASQADSGDGGPRAGRPRWLRVSTDFAVVGHSATRLADGTVLLAGGRGVLASRKTLAAVDRVFRFDPRDNELLADSAMTFPRAAHQAVLLADGRVLVSGGVSKRWGELPDGYRSEVFSPDGPAAQRWKALPDPKAKTMAAGAIGLLLPSGDVLSAYSHDCMIWHPPVARFDVRREQWTELATAPGRSGTPVFLGDDGAPITLGGSALRRCWNILQVPPRPDPSGPLDRIERIDPLSGSVAVIDHLLDPRAYAAGLRLAPSRFLLIGGESAGGLPHVSRSAELVDLSSGARQRIVLDDLLPRPRAVLLPSGKALILGIRDGSPFVATLDGQGRYARIDDPPAPTTLGLQPPDPPRPGWTPWFQYPPVLTMLDDGTVLVSGNADGALWRFYPDGL